MDLYVAHYFDLKTPHWDLFGVFDSFDSLSHAVEDRVIGYKYNLDHRCWYNKQLQGKIAYEVTKLNEIK